MKHLQYFQERKPASTEIGVDTPGSKNKTRNGNALKKYRQNVADGIRNYCLYLLMFVLTGYAVVGKIKNFYEKSGLTAKEGLKILRVIFMAVRDIAPQPHKIQSKIAAFVNHLYYGDLSERLFTQFKTIAPDLYAQIDTVTVTSETVVSALWPYTLSL